VLRTYWSIASFQSLYARANTWTPGSGDGTRAERSLLDDWARNETNKVAAEVDAALEAYDPARAGKALLGLVDDLSNWYVRRSRRRFWDGDPAALQTLHESLETLTKLLAPFVPFVTEKVWQALFAESTGVESVHLASWPAVDEPVERELSDQVALVRRIVELGRAARADAKVKTRQPLAMALVSAPGWDTLAQSLRSEVLDELNVVSVARLADADELIDISVKPNFRTLGRKHGNRTKAVAEAITNADIHALAPALRGTGGFEVAVEGETVNIDTDDVIISEKPRSGWAVASSGAETVALDLELTGELRRLGLLRDIVRIVQEARKNAGFDVTDRILLHWRVGGSPEPAEAIREHSEDLMREVLATSLVEGEPADRSGWFDAEDLELGLHVWLTRAGS
jgi:isoleucyl-tRNA synthetase